MREHDGSSNVRACVIIQVSQSVIPSLITRSVDFVTAEFCANSNRHFFNSAVQLRITVGGAAFVSPMSVPIRNR